MQARPDSLSLGRLVVAACALCCVSSLASSAAASQTVTYSQGVPLQSVPWTQSVNLSAFDSALGILRQVKVTVSASVSGSYGIENTAASPAGPNFNLGSMVLVTLPNNGGMPAPNPAFEYFNMTPLPAFDGSIDYAGTSGTSGSFTNATGTGVPTQSTTLFMTPSYAIYVGPAGNPGQVSVNLQAQAATFTGQGPTIAHTHALGLQANVSIEYTYDALPTTFCHSASWDGCPCGNSGALGHGCGHSFDAQGAQLLPSGSTSLANDTFVLSATQMPESATIFFQGPSMQYVGVPFGDGLRCVTGSLLRLGTKLNSGGAAQYPEGGDLPISIKGMIGAPGTYAFYQAQYRNAAAFCTSLTYNATNGVAVLWTN